MAKTKYVYIESYKFMLGNNRDKNKTVLPFQEEEKVKEAIQHIPVYIAGKPLTKHPYLGNTDTVKSSRIMEMMQKDGFWEATTFSGTCYRLLTE